MAPMKTPAGPWKPDVIPRVANMHIHWLMTYDSLDNASHYSTAMYAQNPDVFMNYGDGTEAHRFPLEMSMYANLFSNQGSRQEPHVSVPNKMPAWHEMALIRTVLWVRRQYFYPRAIIGVFAAVLLTCGVCVYYSCRASLRRRRSKLVMACAKQVPCCPDGVMMVAETVTRCSDVAEHSD
eukprot:UN0669